MTILKICCLFIGLLPLAVCDAKTQTVPLVFCDVWTCTCLILGFLMTPSHVFACFFLFLLLIPFCLARGLGSADLLVLLASAALFGLHLTLICLLLSLFSGLIWALVRHQGRLALLPHILIGMTLSMPMIVS